MAQIITPQGNENLRLLVARDSLTVVGFARKADANGTTYTLTPIIVTFLLFDLNELVQLIASNQKVGAIKWVREKTKLGLKEAKDICDWLSSGGLRWEAEVKVTDFWFSTW